jgi:hypothetical protein
VDTAAAGFAGATCAGFAAAGLAAGDAVPGPLWASAGAAASIMAAAMIDILCIWFALGTRHGGARIKIGFARRGQTRGTGADPQLCLRKCSPRELRSD